MGFVNSDKAFVSSARLYTIVPETSDSSFSEVLSNAEQDDESEHSSLLPVKERRLLFFDETVTVYVILRIKRSSEESLKQYLPRLDLRLDVWAVAGTEAESRGGSKSDSSVPERDLVFTKELEKIDDPFIVLNREGEDENEPVVLAIWETEATLNRPRARFASPALSFVASANLLPPNVGNEDSSGDEYLPSFVPAPANLFEPLKHIPALRDDPPFLPASRLDRVLPSSLTDGGAVRIRTAAPRPVRVVQAVSARIRYSRLETFSPRPMTIASLDFEVTRHIDLAVTIMKAGVVLSQGSADTLTHEPLPLSCRPRDVLTFLYRLHPTRNQELSSAPSSTISSPTVGSTADTITISTEATITLSSSCTAKISMSWTTAIDLAAPLNPSFAAPSQPLNRANRPQSLPVAVSVNAQPMPSTTNTPRNSTLIPTSSSGITISITTPTAPIVVGTPFDWTILVMNHSSTSAKLALIPMTHFPRPSTQTQQFSKRHAPHLSNASNHVSDAHNPTRDIAPAIIDENIIYALQHQSPNQSSSPISPPNATPLLSLTPDLRIGPLAPATCHEATIRLLALQAGALHLEALRVVDLVRESEEGASAPGVMVDIRELPDILAVAMDDDDDEGA